jgi:hypothetical protein
VSALAELEVALRRDRSLEKLSAAYCHRATREDSLGVVKGREAILAAAVAEDPCDVEIEADLGDMVAYCVDGRWRGHRWVWREDGHILREVLVEEREDARMAPPSHAPLGELRAGEGQFAASAEPPLPPGFAAGAKEAAVRLNRQWNGRALGADGERWLIELLRLLPDATFTFEHAVVSSTDVALLWRVMGHASGKRVRLIGSTLVKEAGVRTVLDRGAIAAQLAAGTISYD